MRESQFIPAKNMVFSTSTKDHKRLLEYCKTASSIVINLENVELCDSAGLALLIEACRLAKFSKKQFSIVHIQPHIQALAEFCGVKTILLSEI